MRDYKKEKKIRCIHCAYEWRTISRHIFVTCPSRLKKTPIEPPADLNRQEDQDKEPPIVT